MLIRKMRVEGGFLDNLQLDFTEGLNVLIGPRGSGKTSIVELIRFCLGIPAFTSRAQSAAEDHVLAVLGDGRVALELETRDGPVTASRTWVEKRPSFTAPAPKKMPILLSQREVEQIGVDSAGRLRLIDEFNGAASEGEVDQLRSLATSASSEITAVLRELDTIREEIEGLADTPEELRLILENDVGEKPDEAATEIQRLTSILDDLDEQLAAIAVSLSSIDQTSEGVSGWRRSLEAAIATRPQLPAWPTPGSDDDPISPIQKEAERVLEVLEGARISMDQWLDRLERRRSDLESRQVRGKDEASDHRRKLEELQEGLGARSRQIAGMRERVARLDALRAREMEAVDRLSDLQARRREVLERLDLHRKARFERRQSTAEMLNEELGPELRVSIVRSGLHNEYASAVEDALREGPDRMHYRSLALELAQAMSPRELVELAEAGHVEAIAQRAGITDDRAAKAAAAIADRGGEAILSAPVNDAVELMLLDGKAYKATDHASTGQRCTVVLPILLMQRGRSLIVDQPEDHLDNRFIVDIVVKAVLDRAPEDQLIIATHNANIPVLGDAQHVVVLGSDGARGYPVHIGHLEERETVDHITSLMEGGREAFRRRAEFYGAEWPDADD